MNISAVTNIINALTHSTLSDVFDILLMTIIIYSFIRLIRDSKAYQMAIGIALVGILFLITQWGRLIVSNWLIRNFVNYAIFAIIVLFQGEIRRFLTTLGSRTFRRTIFLKAIAQEWEGLFFAVNYLGKKQNRCSHCKWKKKFLLKSYADTGTKIEGLLSKDLLASIFFPHSPLHDGAVIIKGNKINAAGCLLPLPATHKLGVEFQTRTRHLAAIGLSEETDAAVIVVSEEAGTISLAVQGNLKKNLTKGQLKEQLLNYMK